MTNDMMKYWVTGRNKKMDYMNTICAVLNEKGIIPEYIREVKTSDSYADRTTTVHFNPIVLNNDEIEQIVNRSSERIDYREFIMAPKNAKYRKKLGTIKKVIFQDGVTVILWNDKTKTVVKTQKGETVDYEKGFAMAIAKKFFGNEGNYYEVFKKFLPKEEE